MTLPVLPSDQPVLYQPANTARTRQAIRTIVGALKWCLPAVFLLSACIPGGGGVGAASNPANLAFHPGALRYYREKGLVK